MGDLDALGLTVEECDASVQWISTDTTGRRIVASGPAAIAALLRSSTGPWRVVGWTLGRRLVLAVAWPVYRWVARNRDRMPGGTPACALPSAERRQMKIVADEVSTTNSSPAPSGDRGSDAGRVDTPTHG